jgi:hypothetical protein
MNHKVFSRLLLLVSALASLVVAGCATDRLKEPFTAYGGQAKIHLKVGDSVTDELRRVKNDKWNIPIGETIANNVPVFARHSFDGVVDLNNGQLPPNETVAAILTPRIAYFTRTVGASAGGESIVDIKLEWTLNDVNGKAIWVETIDGRSSASTRTNPKKVTRQALEDLLLKSQQAISSAPAIKQFAQKQSP